ncbi:MAG: hypothetical protein Q9194_002011 [Teloschistes cf. exilis]
MTEIVQRPRTIRTPVVPIRDLSPTTELRDNGSPSVKDRLEHKASLDQPGFA